MLSFEPNIVVIDDKKDEIQGIIDWYNTKGIGCKFFDADIAEGDLMPENSYSDVNLIFLDLFLSEAKVDHEQCSNWIQSIIPEKSFYVLVIWTKDPGEAQGVIDELVKFKRLPFVCLIKNKSDFPSHSEYKYDFTELFKQVDEELVRIPALAEIGVWKKSTKRASNVVIGGLSKNSDPILFKSKLQKIIISHGGTSIKNNTNNNYKRGILFDALDQVLISNTKHSVPTDEIQNINNEQLYKLDEVITADVDRELNSWFHFKLEKNLSQDLIYPGLMSEFSDNEWKRLYSIHDDSIVMEYIRFQNGDAVRITSIALLISRPCDIAQNKFGRNLKLISGLKIVNPVRKDNGRKEFKKGASDVDSIKIYDHLFFSDDEKDVTLLFDFRYNFSVPSDIFLADFTNIKIFNKELLSEMQVEYSSYSSRLGITQVI
jgi:hypothetical protein